MTHPLFERFETEMEKTAICVRCGRPGYKDGWRPHLNIVDDLCWWCFEEEVLETDGEAESLL